MASDPSNRAAGSVPMRDRLSVVNERTAIRSTGQRVIAAAEQAAYSDASCFAIRLAVEEALANAFRHGHRDLDPCTPVSVEYEVERRSIRVSVEDQGPGFSPEDVPDPTAPENITKTSGRGLLLVRSYMTEVRHNDRGNRIEMRYDKPAEADSA
ncbi:MAG: ATP-binding protein [Planctomycetota bacterium]